MSCMKRWQVGLLLLMLQSGLMFTINAADETEKVFSPKIGSTVETFLPVEADAVIEPWSSADCKPPSWRQFHGSDQGHVVSTESLPVVWSEDENIVWKQSIPGDGWSSPIVDGNDVWVTTAMEDERSLRAICLNADTGEIRLNIEVFKPEKLVEKHDRNGHATPTPVVDDERVYVHFGRYGTAALRRSDGEIIWTNQETKINHQWGPGSSPVLYEGLLVFNCDGMEQRYVVALDGQTGDMRWKSERSEQITKGGHYRKAFSTPLVVSVNNETMILTAGANQATTLDPETGKEHWSINFYGYAGVATPVAADGRAFVTSGYGDGTLMAIQLDDSKEHKSGELLWKIRKGAPIISSPIIVGTELYMVSDSGILSCLNAATGEVHWRERLAGNFAASLTYGDGKLYLHNDQGVTTVVEPSTQSFKELASNQLDSNIQASPAAVNGAMYLRTQKSLYRIELRRS